MQRVPRLRYNNYDEKWGETIPKTHEVRIIIMISFQFFANFRMWIAHTSQLIFRAIYAYVCACLPAFARVQYELIFVAVKSHAYAFFALSLIFATDVNILAPIMECFIYSSCGRGKTTRISCFALRRLQIIYYSTALARREKMNEWMQKNNKQIWLAEVITIKCAQRTHFFHSLQAQWKKNYVWTQSVSNIVYWDALQENGAIHLKAIWQSNFLLLFYCICAIMHLGIKCAIKTPCVCVLGCTLIESHPFLSTF